MIKALRQLQHDNGGWLSADALRVVAARSGTPLNEVYGVASFYPEFRLTPPPQTCIKVCTDGSCHLRGAMKLVRLLEDSADPERHEIQQCSCLGQCDRTLALSIDDHVVAGMPDNLLTDLLDARMAGIVQELPPLPSTPPKRVTDPYSNDGDHYDMLRRVIAAEDRGFVIEELNASGLRGMGGAGFPAGRKWGELATKSRRPIVGVDAAGGLINPNAAKTVKKYVICNADESEVGTFKDREILLHHPHLVVEAMIIAAFACDLDYGYIYIRHEYHDQIEACRKELDRVRQLGLLGYDILGSDRAFDIEIFVSPGGYIQGEQSALMEAIEGKRGQPRNRRSDVGNEGGAAYYGLFNGPTLVNNVETLCYLPLILAEGGKAFADRGVNGASGLKWIGVSGDVQEPGVFEVPMGTSFEELVVLAGGLYPGRKLLAFAPSGPTYGLHPPEHLDTPTDFRGFDDDLPGVGSGAMIVLDDRRCVVDVALNLTQFYRNESCGKCVPCRVGSAKMVDVIRDCSVGKNTVPGEDIADVVARLGRTMGNTSICGLGQVVHMPMASVIKWFPEEVEAHLDGRCPAGVCGMKERRA